MMKMWWKLLLLCIYAFILFILARLLEAISWYDSGYLSSRFIDPWALSVRKLKLLLEQRGVSYHGVLERAELNELISASGDVMEGEIESSIKDDADSDSIVTRNFTGETHFYEEVEDRKDSVWVIHVQGENEPPLLSISDWNILIRKLARFGVRSGVFDCSQDWRLCSRKSWYTSRLILALPEGYKAKDNVLLRNYKGTTRVNAVFNWVNKNVASRIKTIGDYNELRKNWFKYEKARRRAEVRVLYFTHLDPPPMFLSFLSVKYTGRVKFGTVNIHSREGKSILKRLQKQKPPTYIVITQNKNYTYGRQKAEYPTFDAMELYLKTLYPETNDIFIFSLIVVNLCCLFELFVCQGGVFTRFWRLILCLGKCNCALLLMWLPILGWLQFPSADYTIDALLKYSRYVTGSNVFASVRADILHPPLSLSWFVFTFIAYGIFIAIIEYKRTGGVEVENANNDWWSGVWDDYTNYLFQPMASLTRPMSPQDLDLEEGMELLIERLAVPDLWLHPMIATDYITQLPVWLYTGKYEGCSSSDEQLYDTDGYDSTTEKQNLTSESQPCHSSYHKATGISLSGLTEESCVKLLMDGNYKCNCECAIKKKLNTGMNGTSESNKSSRVRKSDVCTQPNTCNGAPPGIMYSTECVICLESYRFGATLCGLPCGHSFHENCIMEWLSRDHHWCPLCRWPAYKKNPCKVRNLAD